MNSAHIRAYNEAVYDTDRHRAMKVVETALGDGESPENIIFDLVVPAMEEMIRSISVDFDANLAQHFMTAQIASEVTDAMIARFARPPVIIGRIVIGTAYGDMHSLGKRIVIGCLKARMIEARDLGVNVSPEQFVDEAVQANASVIGISAMMVHTARSEDGCLGVRRTLRERGLEGRIRIVVGGAPFRFDPGLADAVEADAWAADGVSASRIIQGMVQEVRL